MKAVITSCSLALLLLTALWTGPAAAQSAGVEVQQLVLGETGLGSGDRQLVQVTLANTDAQPVTVGVRVEIRNRSRQRFGRPQTAQLRLGAKAEERVYFNFSAPDTQGSYVMKLEVTSPDYKHNILSGKPVFYAPFEVLSDQALARRVPAPDTQAAMRLPTPSAPATFAPPQGLMFESPDLLWENLNLNAPGILVGEPLKERAARVNEGGDIARDIIVRVESVNSRLPGTRQEIRETSVALLAPGDKIELEFEYQFPESTLLGEYNIILTADADDSVDELNEQNNRIETREPLRLSVIRLDFPPAGYHFEEAGLFLFRWDSKLHDEFKVQISTEETFEHAENIFAMPAGDKWTKDRELVPLAGELPGMARGLMIKNDTDTVYWRVLGRNAATGKLAHSQALPFTLSLAADAPEPAQDEAGTPPPPAME